MLFTDQLHRTIAISHPPKKIVSIVPSQSELLFDLGLDEEVIGITKFCIHPAKWLESKTKVGGTKQLNLAVIDSLKPDLIIANKEENTKEQIELLSEKHSVWISDIKTLEDALQMISDIGVITARSTQAEKLMSSIQQSFHELMIAAETTQKKRALYLIWNEPMMLAGSDTFINEMMRYSGFENCIKGQRYPEITKEEIISLHPEYILLSSEPFPFSEKHQTIFRERFPFADVMLVDGEFFSWYGSRLSLAQHYFSSLLKSL